MRSAPRKKSIKAMNQVVSLRSVGAPKTNRAVAPRSAGSKRPLALAVYDLAAAEERAMAARLSRRPGALVPFLARQPVAATPRAQPSWLRERPDIRLDLTMHFIGEKAMTVTDLVGQQNRFRLPTDGVLRVLRPILFDAELDAAKIPRVGALDGPRAPKKPRPPPPTEEEELSQEKKIEKRTKKQGVKHGGLPVHLYNVDAGTMEMRLTRWTSSRAFVVKGEGYVKFIAKCGFKEKDVVEIWAFKQREFRYFGAIFCRERPLCIVLAKKETAGSVAGDGKVTDGVQGDTLVTCHAEAQF